MVLFESLGTVQYSTTTTAVSYGRYETIHERVRHAVRHCMSARAVIGCSHMAKTVPSGRQQ